MKPFLFTKRCGTIFGSKDGGCGRVTWIWELGWEIRYENPFPGSPRHPKQWVRVCRDCVYVRLMRTNLRLVSMWDSNWTHAAECLLYTHPVNEVFDLRRQALSDIYVHAKAEDVDKLLPALEELVKRMAVRPPTDAAYRIMRDTQGIVRALLALGTQPALELVAKLLLASTDPELSGRGLGYHGDWTVAHLALDTLCSPFPETKVQVSQIAEFLRRHAATRRPSMRRLELHTLQGIETALTEIADRGRFEFAGRESVWCEHYGWKSPQAKES
jgi:hypothetical protein